jgi:nucleotide-binding universal stress UspA family protein
MEHQLHGLAEKARLALHERAHRLHVASSFRVARGDVTRTILTAASDADLIIVGRAGWSGVTSARTGATCSAIVSSCRAPVLVVERGARPAPPILALDDGSPAAQRALAIAGEIRGALGWNLAVMRAGKTETSGDVLLHVHSRRPSLVIVPAGLFQRGPSSQMRCPVLIVP